MRDYGHLARTALKVLLARRRLALLQLERGDHEAADESLSKCRAAYHNFRAADHAARSRGEDVARDPEMRAVFAELTQVDRSLEEAMRSQRVELKGSMEKVRRSRQIRNYRSGQMEDSGFEECV